MKGSLDCSEGWRRVALPAELHISVLCALGLVIEAHRKKAACCHCGLQGSTHLEGLTENLSPVCSLHGFPGVLEVGL